MWTTPQPCWALLPPHPPSPASLQHCVEGSPWQMQCWWTVFTWPSRWSRASACPLRRGARPSYSRQSVGSDQHHPLAWGKRGSYPSSHIIWVSPSTAAVVGAGSLRVCWDIPGFVSLFPGTPSSAQRPVTSPDLPTAGQGHTRGMEQGSVCCCCTLPALKNKILSSLFLQVFPSYSS